MVAALSDDTSAEPEVLEPDRIRVSMELSALILDCSVFLRLLGETDES